MQDIEVGLYVVVGEVLLYGAYLTMFGFYLHVLRKHGVMNNRFLTIATIALFLLCTAHCALQLAITKVANTIAASPKLPLQAVQLSVALNRASNTIYVTSNIIADAIFIFRCYAIWNFRWRIVILPVFLTIMTAAAGYINVGVSLQEAAAFSFDPTIAIFSGGFAAFLFLISVSLSVITTLILMGLSAGRIWWLASGSGARRLVGQQVVDKYTTISAMMLESGALYCAGSIAFVIVSGYELSGMLDTNITTSGAILGQLVGIAPTIIAVRVGLGKRVESATIYVPADSDKDAKASMV